MYKNNNGSTQTTFYDGKDHGPNPFAVNIEQATLNNVNFRTTLWTGDHLQTTLMSIPIGGEIGLENHPHLDQFLRIEQGLGFVKMGKEKDKLTYQGKVNNQWAVFIPAGTWHNLINIGNVPLKLYSIYSPPEHPHGTIHRTKTESDEAEHH